MKHAFEYLRPGSVGEAIAMKTQYLDRACYWAGGTDLMLLWRRGEIDIDYCIDLTRLSELAGIEDKGSEVTIGAMASLDALDQSAEMNTLMDVLGYTARLMCTKQTRTIGTVGGNLCNASPGADLSPLFVALDSRAVIAGVTGHREVPMEDFFTGVNQTALVEGELLYQIIVPIPSERREASYKRVARTFVDIALVSASVSITEDNGAISDSRIVLGSVAPVPIRVPEAERLLVGQPRASISETLLDDVDALAKEAARPISDVRAGAAYRRNMCGVLARRALEDSLQRMNGAAR